MDSATSSNMACVTVRDITRAECTWLTREFRTNEVVYLFDGATYNCISRNGKAYTEIEKYEPIF